METETIKKLFTVQEYYRMYEAGILDHDLRTELINGEILELTDMAPRHSAAVARITDRLLPMLKDKAQLRPQLPLRVDKYNEPMPDFLFVTPRADYYESTHPDYSNTLLAIEVSDTTLAKDQGLKLRLYAKTGICEYWILDVAHGVLLIYREPRGESFAFQSTLHRGEVASTSLIPDVAIAVSDLLGPLAE